MPLLNKRARVMSQVVKPELSYLFLAKLDHFILKARQTFSIQRIINNKGAKAFTDLTKKRINVEKNIILFSSIEG